MFLYEHANVSKLGGFWVHIGPWGPDLVGWLEGPLFAALHVWLRGGWSAKQRVAAN